VGLAVEDSQMTNPNIVMMVAADLIAWRSIGLRPMETAAVQQLFTHHQALATMVALSGDAALSTTSMVVASST